MMSAQGLVSISLLASFVEGSSIQRASLQFSNSNNGENVQLQNNKALSTPGRGFVSLQNVSELKSVSPNISKSGKQTTHLNIVTGTPVNGGAKTPSFEEFIIKQPLKINEKTVKSRDNFIRNVLEAAATKVNDVDFLHAIKMIEKHLEETVGGTRKTNTTATTVTPISTTDTSTTSASVLPQNIVRKFVINSNNEISEVKENIENSHTSLNANKFDSDAKRSSLNSFSRSSNLEGRKKIILVPRNMSIDDLKRHLPQFSSQNLRVAELVKTAKTGSRTGNLLVMPQEPTNMNNRMTVKPLTQTTEQQERMTINQPIKDEQTIQQNKVPSHLFNNSAIHSNSDITKTDDIQDNLSSKIQNETIPQNSLIGDNRIDHFRMDFDDEFDDPFPLQRENFPYSNFSLSRESMFATFSKSTDELENLNPPKTQSTIKVKEQPTVENPFVQSKLVTDSFTPSLYIGPIQIEQFIKSVQPTINGDLDDIKASKITKVQRRTDSVNSNVNRLNNESKFGKPSFFEFESREIFEKPFIFNQENFERPKIQPLQHEITSNIDNSRFRDDLQLSNMQTNLEVFPETRTFNFIPHQTQGLSPSNNVVSARSDVDTLDLSWFGTNHPGMNLAAFDPQIRLTN